MIKFDIKVEFASSDDSLKVKMIGSDHDRCQHLYSGLSEETPSHLQKYVTENKKYIFIYKEERPLVQQ